MLKQCLLEDLRAGMVLGRPICETNGNILLEEGTVLTVPLIDSLLTRPVFSVYVEEQASAKSAVVGNAPIQEHLLDTPYVDGYQRIFTELDAIFHNVHKSSGVDTDAVEALVTDGKLLELCDGMKAITQIHNMPREGNYLLHHSMHVAILSGLMGHWMDMPRERIHKLVISGLLHDIGKLKISEDILDKRGRLSIGELNVVRRHAAIGYDMLRYGRFAGDREILMGVLQHHERNDGSGYPNGIKAEEISDFGRILAIMDIYDAMITNRAYAKRTSPFDVFQTLSVDIMNGKLDTEYGVLFVHKICHALNGSWVHLSNGKKAKIIYIDESRISALPIVQTASGEFIDLNMVSGIKITELLMNNEI